MSANKSRPKAAEENSYVDSTADAERAEAIAQRRARDAAWFRANPTRNAHLRFVMSGDAEWASPAGVVLVQRGLLDDGGPTDAWQILDRWPAHAPPPWTAPDDAAVYAVCAWAEVRDIADLNVDSPETVAKYAEHLMYHLWRWARIAPLWFATPEGHA